MGVCKMVLLKHEMFIIDLPLIIFVKKSIAMNGHPPDSEKLRLLTRKVKIVERYQEKSTPAKLACTFVCAF